MSLFMDEHPQENCRKLITCGTYGNIPRMFGTNPSRKQCFKAMT